MDANKSPVVSVVMPVYNGETYLPEAIESILNQTFTDFEFIIIDDGSTDSTPQILAAYAAQDARIVLYRHPKNLGLIKTLNAGVSLARGEYLARHDADDVSLPERLATQVRYLQEHPEVGLLGTAYYRLYLDGVRKLCQPPVTDTGIRWKLLFNNIWCHPSMMFSRRLVIPGKAFYKDFPHIEDYELWTRLVKHVRAATLTLPLVVYRVHNNSICATHADEQARQVAAISVQQINALFPEQHLNLSELEMLRRCYLGKSLTKRDIVQGSRLVFQLFNVFAQQPNIDREVVQVYRRRWIKSLLAEATHWPALWRAGLLQTIVRQDLLALLMGLFIHFPKRTLGQLITQRIFTYR